jgi:hypothetical protein
MSFPEATALRQRIPDTRRIALAGVGVGVASSSWLAGQLITSRPEGARLALAVACGLALFAVGLVSPRLLVYVLVVWLAALGAARRLLTEISPPGGSDVLLLVAPTGVFALLLAARARGAFRNRTRLANTVLVLGGLIVLGALNPLQGGLAVGLGGLLFLLVPLLWFWIGRALCDDVLLRNVFRLLVVLSVPAALYGIHQTFVGFPSWDEQWIRESGYQALNVYGVTRPFSSFSAASEYATFLAIGIVILVGLGLKMRFIAWTGVAIGLLAVAVFLQSGRGVVFVVALALALMAAARLRVSPVVAMGFGALGLLAVPYLTSQFAPGSYRGEAAPLVQHQVEGLADPLSPETSTLQGHFDLVGLGIGNAFTSPLGVGTGAVTTAGTKFGGTSAGTETDPSNLSTALGLPGLLAYAVLLLVAFQRTYAVAARGDRLALIALGILTVTILQWFNGGQYAVAPIPWLVLGWLDGRQGQRE